ncbi:DUF4256 domain-containing protein [Pseudomonas sp. MYb185]|uniref:DUF4256 domain-containing protein n=1 Tax=Pseudomonas sp. MYb185 TaxID=1848729 RepID=UPI000CFC1F0C|nr:DUF4256 domain-containing protein [Pseudomonas sp. MYb185]PRB77524.1 hypothetical protein CQ007_16440 [Pseudomonas sp. MYb185]
MNAQQRAALLETLRSRFAGNMSRHRDIDWADVESRLEARPHKLRCLLQMENTGGEPDVIGVDLQSGELLFVDCSAESPTGRRSLCYDREALEARKTHKPANCATDLAAAMGIEILTEEQYRMLQTLGCFDSKTSSWVATPPGIRRLGGALFCDRRYNQVFLYHNGAQSYYAARGFRGMLRV